PDRGVPRVFRRPRRPARRVAVGGHRSHGRDARGSGDRLPLDARRVLRGRRRSRRRDRRGLGRPAPPADPRRPGRGRLPPPDLHEDRTGSPDALLRGDRAPRRTGFRGGELQGAVRGDRARAGPPRQSLSDPQRHLGSAADHKAVGLSASTPRTPSSQQKRWKPMRRLIIPFVLLVGVLTLAASGLADPGDNGKGKAQGKNKFSFSLTTTDRRCDSTDGWATLTETRTYQVHDNGDGTFRLPRVDKGTFMTALGKTPG